MTKAAYMARRFRTAWEELHEVFDPHAASFPEVASAMEALDQAVRRELPGHLQPGRER